MVAKTKQQYYLYPPDSTLSLGDQPLSHQAILNGFDIIDFAILMTVILNFDFLPSGFHAPHESNHSKMVEAKPSAHKRGVIPHY